MTEPSSPAPEADDRGVRWGIVGPGRIAARANGVFVMEAMWTRFQPVIVRARELIADGAMLDLGVYVVSFTQMLLGTPTSVTARGSLVPSGVDQEAGVLLGYDDDRTGALTIPIRNQSPGSARIFGSAGWIDVVPRLHHPTTIEVTDCLRAGRTESAVMPLQDTLDVQAILEEAGRQLGVTYSEDSSQ